MTAQRSSVFPRPRTLIHPGAFNPVRIHSGHSLRARHVRLLLQPGMSLFDGLVHPLLSMDIQSASMTILGGYFEALQYCVAPPDPKREAVIRYSEPIDAGRAYMVFGNATMGKDMQDQPLVHCHAAIRTEQGASKGGHIITQNAIVGPAPISVLVTSLDGFNLRVAFDPETNIPLIQPLQESNHE